MPYPHTAPVGLCLGIKTDPCSSESSGVFHAPLPFQGINSVTVTQARIAHVLPHQCASLGEASGQRVLMTLMKIKLGLQRVCV